ncbi:hypothetical protein [Rhizobium laguerreae]|uniref:hypothetical protein n=1 Tax=Rhizobium laguerreae TaxID=1076926 RepID=UPI001C902216|nr:hypothetical protein [Rhizobium laguerreae]
MDGSHEDEPASAVHYRQQVAQFVDAYDRDDGDLAGHLFAESATTPPTARVLWETVANGYTRLALSGSPARSL